MANPYCKALAEEDKGLYEQQKVHFNKFTNGVIQTHTQLMDETLLEFLSEYLKLPSDIIFKMVSTGKLRVKHCIWNKYGYNGADQFVVNGRVVFEVYNGAVYKLWKENK